MYEITEIYLKARCVHLVQHFQKFLLSLYKNLSKLLMYCNEIFLKDNWYVAPVKQERVARLFSLYV